MALPQSHVQGLPGFPGRLDHRPRVGGRPGAAGSTGERLGPGTNLFHGHVWQGPLVAFAAALGQQPLGKGELGNGDIVLFVPEKYDVPFSRPSSPWARSLFSASGKSSWYPGFPHVLCLGQADPKLLVRSPRPRWVGGVGRLEDRLVWLAFGLGPGLDEVDQVPAPDAVGQLEPMGGPLVAVGLPLFARPRGKVFEFGSGELHG